MLKRLRKPLALLTSVIAFIALLSSDFFAYMGISHIVIMLAGAIILSAMGGILAYGIFTPSMWEDSSDDNATDTEDTAWSFDSDGGGGDGD